MMPKGCPSQKGSLQKNETQPKTGRKGCQINGSAQEGPQDGWEASWEGRLLGEGTSKQGCLGKTQAVMKDLLYG